MHVSTKTNTQAYLRLRVEKFDLMTKLLGVDTYTAQAELVGVTYRTVLRARTKPVGEVFVAQTVAALQRHADLLARYGLTVSLDELFTVETSAAEAVPV